MSGSATFTIVVSIVCINVAAMIAVGIRTSENPLSIVGYWLPSPGLSSAIRHLRRKGHCGLRMNSPQRPKSLRALAFAARLADQRPNSAGDCGARDGCGEIYRVVAHRWQPAPALRRRAAAVRVDLAFALAGRAPAALLQRRAEHGVDRGAARSEE